MGTPNRAVPGLRWPVAGIAASARLGMCLIGCCVELLGLLLGATFLAAVGWLLLAYLLSRPHGRRRRR